MGQTADCDLRVERLMRRRRVDKTDLRAGRQETVQSRRADECHIHPRARHQRQIAKELDRVAETVIVEHEDALAWLPAPPPGRKARSERLGERLALKPARLVSLETALEIAERQEKAAFAGDRFAAAERLGGLKGRERFVEAPEIAQRQRFAAQSRSKARPRGAGAAIGEKRLVHAVELQERIAEIDRGFGEVGAQRERAARSFERLLETSEFAQSSGATAPGVGVAGRKRGRRFESGECFREAPRVKQQLARIDVSDGERGVEAERPSIEAQSGLGLAALAEHIAAHAESFGEIGPAPQGLVKARDCVFAPSFPPGHACRGVERVGFRQRGARGQIGSGHCEQHPRERRLRGPFARPRIWAMRLSRRA